MLQKISEAEPEYEDSDPMKYGTSVYSVPHWMVSFANPNKRRKLRASDNQRKSSMLDISAVAPSGSHDSSSSIYTTDPSYFSGNRVLCRPEVEMSEFSYVATAFLSWSWICTGAGAREEISLVRSIRARAYSTNTYIDFLPNDDDCFDLPPSVLKRKRKVNKKRIEESNREGLHAPANITRAVKATALGNEIQRCLEREEKTRIRYEEKIVSLFCNHCKLTFKAKPTYRKKFNHTLVNHSCSGTKRKQYVLGVKRRKCIFNCSAYQGCIYRL